ncbi:MAG: ribonuclease H-like domain-containing protein [Lachnospiraceae bacterium]|nr:ribonuclease H-like domain-containing protein [Lachnospiraceae bacterium]
MKISNAVLNGLKLNYPLEKFASLDNIFFLDIETTGFTARSSCLYMIGCAYFRNNQWKVIQWMAEDYSQEAEIIEAFFNFAKDYDFMIHFNGNNFDIPFLTHKCAEFELPYNFDNLYGLDLYKKISPCKFFLHLPNCKQKTLEQFLGIDRTDVFSGGELISIYHDYVKSPTKFAEDSLFLHNSDDLRGMLEILPILAYPDMFTEGVRAKKVQANYYKDYDGNTKREILITLAVPNSLPKKLSAGANDCYFKCDKETATIRVPIYEEELKYFYDDYKDYYYLPEEDVALHKSVASYVDRAHRLQANAKNCYTRKYSSFLPQWAEIFTPVFKRDYSAREIFFELTEDMKRNRQGFTDYANHLLHMIASIY